MMEVSILTNCCDHGLLPRHSEISYVQTRLEYMLVVDGLVWQFHFNIVLTIASFHRRLLLVKVFIILVMSLHLMKWRHGGRG
jgi:hypothetical protein